MVCNLARLPAGIAREWTGASDDEIYEMLDEGVYPKIDLDKSWHVLHFLLTGEISDAPMPLGFLLVGGEPMGEDLGFGPGRVFFPPEVAEIDTALAKVTTTELRAAYRPESMAELYGWNSRWDVENLNYFLPYFENLKTFIHESRGNALLIYLN
jgi:hypothetical protein